MASKIGPVDQGLNGKASNKVDEVSGIRKVSHGSASHCGQAKDPASKNDIGELTLSAELLERLEKSLSSVPTVDSIRVTEIRTAIDNGDYQSDADAIVEAMIRFERALGE
ncbi:MAG: flagellar biosynthesis anti-sigma factor FlgM [Gammaproteobacteria bacterium]|nr:flagellar biosynthesis anti-sigma factor FlgM [Gammaproteobacteria bacterium]MDH3752164.1 flagellar biosynthesis anti-sigma factor FlgM [Gammaproteobacteria bacterium]MDH3806230.1 flagellar biosynthesis anti-sigma factor FlgM [Gammaproteobacteria bacterium]